MDTKITSLKAENISLYSIYISWSNTNNNYDSLSLDYFIKEQNSSFRANLNSDIINFQIKELKPGSTLLITISVILNGSVIDVSDQLTAYTSKPFKYFMKR